MIAVRRTWFFARSAAVGTIVALVLAAAVPVVFGGRTFTVMSGSMEPNVATGDLVITMPMPPGDAVSGDIVTFHDPSGKDRLITHRVASSARAGSEYRFVTKGDANDTVERWAVPADGRIGHVVLRLPKLGYALALTKSSAARLALISIPALLLAGFALASIWKPRRKEGEDVPATA